MVLAFAGSAAGAAVASQIPREAFEPIVLVALIVVGAYVLFKPELGEQTALRFAGHRHLRPRWRPAWSIGFYDGALGPGTGSFFVFTLVGLLGYSFLEASAKARLANWATNLAAILVFAPQGAVLWKVALVMGVCNLVGGYVGARTAVRRGARFVRVFFIVVVSAFIVTDRRRGVRAVVTSLPHRRRRRRGRDRGQAVALPLHDRAGRGRGRRRAVVERLRKQHWDARHHCSAFVLGPPDGRGRALLRRRRAGRHGGRPDARGAPRPRGQRRRRRGHPLVRRHPARRRRPGPGVRRRRTRRARRRPGRCAATWSASTSSTSTTPTPAGSRASCGPAAIAVLDTAYGAHVTLAPRRPAGRGAAAGRAGRRADRRDRRNRRWRASAGSIASRHERSRRPRRPAEDPGRLRARLPADLEGRPGQGGLGPGGRRRRRRSWSPAPAAARSPTSAPTRA